MKLKILQNSLWVPGLKSVPMSVRICSGTGAGTLGQRIGLTGLHAPCVCILRDLPIFYQGCEVEGIVISKTSQTIFSRSSYFWITDTFISRGTWYYQVYILFSEICGINKISPTTRLGFNFLRTTESDSHLLRFQTFSICLWFFSSSPYPHHLKKFILSDFEGFKKEAKWYLCVQYAIVNQKCT